VAAYDLAASRLVWTQPGAVTTRIAVGGDIIIHGSNAPVAAAAGGPAPAMVVARDIGNGAVLWQHALASGERLAGYDIDANAVYLVVQKVGATQRGTTGSVVALDPRTKTVRWQHELPTGRVAGPAVRGGLVAVPVDSQYVILLDGVSGSELARCCRRPRRRRSCAGCRKGMFYGSRGVFLLAPSTARGSRQAPGYLLAKLPPFVRPFYWYDLYRPEQAQYSAIDRNHILWRVAVEGDRARFRDDTVVVHDYRFLFGFDATSGALRWAYSHPSDAVASTDTGSVVAPSSAATATSGRRSRDGRAPLSGAASGRGRSRRRPSTRTDFRRRWPASEAGAAPDVVATLGAIVADPDKRFPDLKLFAIDEIGRQPGREATGKLLEILGGRGLPPLAVQKTSEALAARRDTQSADLLAAALPRHADYAEGRTAPPIDFLARAVAALGPGGRSVWPELVAQLRQPETPTPAAAQIARALIATAPRRRSPRCATSDDVPRRSRPRRGSVRADRRLRGVDQARRRRRSPPAAVRRRGCRTRSRRCARTWAGARETDPGSRKDGDAGLTDPHRLTVVVCRGPTCGDKRARARWLTAWRRPSRRAGWKTGSTSSTRSAWATACAAPTSSSRRRRRRRAVRGRALQPDDRRGPGSRDRESTWSAAWRSASLMNRRDDHGTAERAACTRSTTRFVCLGPRASNVSATRSASHRVP
jgi:outer membrane protein assembly factor BamB